MTSCAIAESSPNIRSAVGLLMGIQSWEITKRKTKHTTVSGGAWIDTFLKVD